MAHNDRHAMIVELWTPAVLEWLKTVMAPPESPDLTTLIEDVLRRIESGYLGSIGSIRNTYMPQIGVDEVQRWRAVLAAHSTRPPKMMPTTHHPAGFPACVNLAIKFNEHALLYQTVEQWEKDQDDFYDWISPEERVKAIETDSVWTCHWYPDTPVGFNAFAASTFDALMDAVRLWRI